jgi:hypothetical protein
MALKKSKNVVKSQDAPTSMAVLETAARAVTIQPQRYNDVVAKAALAGITLVSADFKIEPSFYAPPKPEESRELSFNGELAHFSFDGADGRAVGIFTWWMEARASDAVALKTTASYTIQYEGLAGQEEMAVRAFVARVGRFATFPYFRALASQFNWESGAGLPPMPVLRDGPPKAQSQAKS